MRGSLRPVARMKRSSASATSAAARMDIEKAAQDARTVFFMTCPPLTEQNSLGILRGAPRRAPTKIMRAPNGHRQARARPYATLSGKCKLPRTVPGLTYNRIHGPHGGTIDGASGRADRSFGAPAGRGLALRAVDVRSSYARTRAGRGVHRRCSFGAGGGPPRPGRPARERAGLAAHRLTPRPPQRKSLSRRAAQPVFGLCAL